MCFPHILNMCIQHTLKELNNGVNTDIEDNAANEGSKHNHDDNQAGDDKGGDNEGGDNEGGDNEGGDSGSRGEEDIAISNVPGNLLNKIWAIVRGIHASDQQQENFGNVILGGNQYGWWKDGQGKMVMIKPKQLLQDVRHWWDSTYQMLV